MKIDSLCVHGLKSHKNGNSSHCPPIYATSTFEFDSVENCHRAYNREKGTFVYSRWGNPTIELVEEKIASLEAYNLLDKNRNSLQLKSQLFSSGMGAISTLLMSLLSSGDKILTHGSIYGGSAELMDIVLPKNKINRIIADLQDLSKVNDILKKDKTIKVVYFESPANPTIDCYDIEEIVFLAKKYSIKTIIDNTFCTPYLQQPFMFGVDFVIHSTTKYLNGHGTGIGGVVIGKDIEFMRNRLFTSYKLIGANSNAFDAWLVNIGISTLSVRMEKHCSNTFNIAHFLNDHPKITKVNYLGFPDHPQHKLARKQMKNFGGMLSFEVKGGLKAGIKLMNNVKFCKLAASLGTVDTLIQHPASMTHVGVDRKIREFNGINDNLIRLSVGIENPEDIIADIENALG